MMKQIAALNAKNEELARYIRDLRINREVLDDGMRGGHFYFDDTSDDAAVEIIDAFADDSDGAVICITLHLIGKRGNWAEWYRLPSTPLDSNPVLKWPPNSVRNTLRPSA